MPFKKALVIYIYIKRIVGVLSVVKIMDTIGNILEKKQLQPKSNRTVLEWQDRAVRMSEQLGVELSPKDKPSWFRMFRETPKSQLDKVYSYLADYEKPITPDHKLKLFYWCVRNL